MGTSPSNPSSDIKWTDKAAVVAAVIAVVLSIVALFLNYGTNVIAQEANDIAITAQSYNVTQDAKQYASTIEVNYYLAQSPDLLAEEDDKWISRRELVPLVVQSRFWRTERAQFQDESQRRFLFIFIINHGPGTLKSISLSSINWSPKKDQQVPADLAPDRPLGVLPSSAFLALLIDVLESPDPIDYLKDTHFETLEFTIGIKDTLGQEAQLPINMEDIGPFKIVVP